MYIDNRKDFTSKVTLKTTLSGDLKSFRQHEMYLDTFVTICTNFKYLIKKHCTQVDVLFYFYLRLV